jgi:hypothetical protein
MTCSWRWFIHPETAISKKRNGPSTLCVFKTHYRDRRATVANHLIFMQIQFPDHTASACGSSQPCLLRRPSPATQIWFAGLMSQAVEWMPSNHRRIQHLT